MLTLQRPAFPSDKRGVAIWQPTGASVAAQRLGVVRHKPFGDLRRFDELGGSFSARLRTLSTAD
jgi:hypothetical protein